MPGQLSEEIPKSLRIYTNRKLRATMRCVMTWRLDIPPDCTVCMNDFVIPLYLLLYSTVHHFSSTASQTWRFCFSSTSSFVKGRIDNPSRAFAAHHVDCGRVRFERCAPGFLDDGPACPEVFETLFACMTLEPKNLRISASLSRCASDTDRRSLKA